MAGSDERVGGISVDIGGSLTELEAALTRAEEMIKERTSKFNAQYNLGGKGGGGASSGKSGGATDIAALEKAVNDLTSTLGRDMAKEIKQAREDAGSVSFGTGSGAKVAGGQLSQYPAHIQRQIAAALGQSEQATDGLIGKFESFRDEASTPVVIAMDTRKAEASAERMSSVAADIAPNFDVSGVDKAIDKIDLLSERLTMLAEQAKEPIKINISDPAAASGGGGGGGVRRAQSAAGEGDDKGSIQDEFRALGLYNINTRGNNPNAVRAPRDPEVEANRREFATRQRMFLGEIAAAERRTSSTGAPSAAEAALIDALFPPPGRTGTRQRPGPGSSPLGDYPPGSFEEQGPSSGIARLRTPEEMAAFQRSERQRAADMQRHTSEAELAGVRRSNSERLRGQAEVARREHRSTQEELSFTESAGRGSRGGAGGGRLGQRTEADVELREQQRIAVAEAARVSAGRTARTQASGLGGFFFGGGRGQQEALAGLAAANDKVAIAQRRVNDPAIQRDVRARRQAVEELTGAQNEQADALKRVQSYSGVGAGIKNLLSVTAAGAAFGIGLEAINVAFKAAEKAATPYFDQATGYAQKTADLTTALADQARAQQGNAQGVTALRLAQSGFAASTTASIQPLIAQRAQVEAGNKALVEQVETFRIAENLRRQGSAAGIGGSGTGGVFGTSLFGIPSTGEQAGNFLQGLQQGVVNRQGALAGSSGALFAGNDDPIGRALGLNKGPSQISKDQQALSDAMGEQERGLSFINEQLVLGGNAAAQFTKTLDKADPRIERTAQAFDQISPEMAKAIRETGLFSNGIKNSTEAIAALQSLNLAGTLTGPAQQLAAQQIAAKNQANSIEAIRAEQARTLPAFVGQLVRSQQLQQNVQLPAQAALANLAAPPTPVGTGRVAANAREQRQINAETAETQHLQDGLNAYYEQGESILRNTYQPQIVQDFGAAAGTVFDNLLDDITATGVAMAKVQASISNEQAEYQTAQFNYQLFIARRTLSDIGGLTGKNFGAGKSYLGVLEGQNLALSRQAQLLQFNLSQRQINFQTAVAGFVVPGLTPAEQNARVTEARKEAEFAQKQLDIQKQMFGNQVKIVDISNLRQGADLVKQIRLLERGRQVAIDTAGAQEKLERLGKIQQHLLAQAGTYISAVDARSAKVISNIAEQENALGRALNRIESQAVRVAQHVGEAFFIAASGGFLGGGGGGGGGGSVSGGRGGTKSPITGGNAYGGVFSTQGTTSLGSYGVAGEAGKETVAILRNPRMLMNGGGGGGDSVVNFYGDIHVRSDTDIEAIARRVTAAQGRTAQLKGLRGPN